MTLRSFWLEAPKTTLSLRAVRLGAAGLFTALIVGLAALLPSSVAQAAAANPAEAFVQQNIDRGYTILNNKGLSEDAKRSQFRAFMLGLTDIKRIGTFTLGQYANSASPAEIAAFDAAFTDYAIAVYESRLSKYDGQTLKVTGSTVREADDVVVNADVVNPNDANAPTIKAAFRVRKTADGHPIVTDMQVEGVWLAISQRSDFTGFLQQHGGKVSALTADLIRQTNQIVSNSNQG